MSSKKLPVQIRWTIRRDMPAVLRIERDCFDFNWCEEDFLSCLRQRNCIGMVAEHDNRVVGFMIYELHKTRLHILNFAVAPRYRRSAIGAQMIEKLINKLSQQRRQAITLEIRETNLPAQFFFRAMGFRAKQVIRHLYVDSREDAYRFEYVVPGSQADDPYVPVNRISSLYQP